MDYLKKPLRIFLKDLASSLMSPGGGSAAALTAAMGVGLIEMVSRIDEKRFRKKRLSAAPSQRHAKACRPIRIRLERLITKDVEAFLKLTAIPKEKRSGDGYQKTLKLSAGVPFDICRLCYQAALIADAEKPYVSKWLYSDLLESTILLEAAFRSAVLNVNCNLFIIKDLRYVRGVRSKLNSLHKKILRVCAKFQSEKTA
jgi:methenyltetrahydrofolate cyclohydrolase